MAWNLKQKKEINKIFHYRVKQLILVLYYEKDRVSAIPLLKEVTRWTLDQGGMVLVLEVLQIFKPREINPNLHL